MEVDIPTVRTIGANLSQMECDLNTGLGSGYPASDEAAGRHVGFGSASALTECCGKYQRRAGELIGDIGRVGLGFVYAANEFEANDVASHRDFYQLRTERS